MTYTFTIEPDPDDQEFFSIVIHNGEGSSAEVAGKIGHRAFAALILHVVRNLTQAQICEIWGLL